MNPGTNKLQPQKQKLKTPPMKNKKCLDQNSRLIEAAEGSFLLEPAIFPQPVKPTMIS
jgi:hypothetical protein